jgi:hypothetical protein
MAISRMGFSSGVLKDGRVYVIGGVDTSTGTATPLGEIYDPVADTWEPIVKPAEFDFIQGAAPSAVLADGRVLIGNLQTTSPPFKTALWDPSAGQWTVAGSAFGANPATDTKNSNCEGETWTLLPDGSVLAVNTFDTPLTERYIPWLDQWVSTGKTQWDLAFTTYTDPMGNTVDVFETGPAILLPDGQLFAIGATGQTALYTPPPAGSDPTTNPGTWTTGPAFPVDMETAWPTLTAIDAPAVLQTNGKVLLTAGYLIENDEGQPYASYASLLTTFLEFDPTTNALSAIPGLPYDPTNDQIATFGRFLLLPTGQILLATGAVGTYLYTPDPASNNPADAWRPANISVPPAMYLGYSYILSGTQLNGLSQAVSLGASAQMATNYPIVQLTNAAGQVRYARSHDFSTMGVATGPTVQSCAIDIPSDLPSGAWNLVVIANGIPSEPVPVNLTIYPCQVLLDDPPNAGDYNTLAEFRAAFAAWKSELKACEAQYGPP